MIPAPFRYLAADSVPHAVSLLREHGDDAVLIAGGMSLLPLMKLRLATPAVLVDLARCGLSGIGVEGDGNSEVLVLGAMTSYRDIVRSPLVGRHAPLLARATSLVGDPQVRARGTIGGAVAHADPASDVSTALVALGATCVVHGPSGARSIAIDDVFTGFWTSTIAHGEVLTEIRVPSAAGAGWAYEKFTIRTQDWALVAAAVCGDRIALASMGDRVMRATAAEEALRAGAPIAQAAGLADQGTDPPSDLRGNAAYRRHLARVLVGDALTAARSQRNTDGGASR